MYTQDIALTFIAALEACSGREGILKESNRRACRLSNSKEKERNDGRRLEMPGRARSSLSIHLKAQPPTTQSL